MTEQTEANIKYEKLKKSLASMGFAVHEKGDFVSIIHDRFGWMGVINYREYVEVVIDMGIDGASKIRQIVNDADIQWVNDWNLHDVITTAQIKNLRDQVISLREKLSYKIAARYSHTDEC